ncbi:MAG: AzlC family ABC transporter permease [Motilibacteraceae bacterium]
MSSSQPAAADGWPARRRAVVRSALAVGAATGAYGVSFGAVSTAAGLSVPQTCALSVLMFTGGSQFALVGVLGAGGAAGPAAAAAVMLGARNTFYGLRLAELLRVRGASRVLAAQLVIDESTAVAVAQRDEDAARLGFWSTGLAIYVLWNLTTLLGALGATALADPQVLGLDVAAPAAFLALLAPRLRGGGPGRLALGAGALALVLTPLVAPGVPVLAAAGLAVVVALLTSRSSAVMR